MNVLDTLRGLVRRWYITVPGVLLAVIGAIGVWNVTPAEYSRSASQVLIPGQGILPEGATNSFLYMGGLVPVADVLTRAAASDDVIRQASESSGGEVVIGRDTDAAGPVVATTATAASDEAAAQLVGRAVEQIAVTLDTLQAEQGIPPQDRVTISTVSIAPTSVVRERPRVIAAAAVGAGVVVLSLVVASVVDGLVLKRRRRPAAPAAAGAAEGDPDDDVTADEVGDAARQREGQPVALAASPALDGAAAGPRVSASASRPVTKRHGRSVPVSRRTAGNDAEPVRDA